MAPSLNLHGVSRLTLGDQGCCHFAQGGAEARYPKTRMSRVCEERRLEPRGGPRGVDALEVRTRQGDEPLDPRSQRDRIEALPRRRQQDEALGEALIATLQREPAIARLDLRGERLAERILRDMLQLHLAEIGLQVAPLQPEHAGEERLEKRPVTWLLGQSVAPETEEGLLRCLDARRQGKHRERSTVARLSPIFGGIAHEPLDPRQALAVGREDDHELLRQHHRADAARVGDAGPRVDEDIVEPRGQELGEGGEETRRTREEVAPREGVHPGRIVLVVGVASKHELEPGNRRRQEIRGPAQRVQLLEGESAVAHEVRGAPVEPCQRLEDINHAARLAWTTPCSTVRIRGICGRPEITMEAGRL